MKDALEVDPPLLSVAPRFECGVERLKPALPALAVTLERARVRRRAQRREAVDALQRRLPNSSSPEAEAVSQTANVWSCGNYNILWNLLKS